MTVILRLDMTVILRLDRGTHAARVDCMLKILVKRIDDGLPLPSYARLNDAGCDLLAAEAAHIEPGGGRALVGTGISIAIPPGYGGFVQPRSGLVAKHGV